MITKQLNQTKAPADRKLKAGFEAERQMAFYLNRAFANDSAVYILNDLRLVDPEQPEHDGSPGVCQMDHLVVHRCGMFIIESKSVHDEVSVRGDGSGGDEWTRRYKGRESGFPSPIQQARRQAEFLRVFLQRNREQLLGKVRPGFRALAKVIAGSDQRGFLNIPIQIIVAISDSGKIRRVKGWKEPVKPFHAFVTKADLAADKIREEFQKHQASGKLLGKIDGDYGLWVMQSEETVCVAEFLSESHTPLCSHEAVAEPKVVYQQPVVAIKTQAAKSPELATRPCCKACQSTQLFAHSGRYGYYWKCQDCDTNTTMPTTCTVCNAKGSYGKVVKIRKEGIKYFRCCEACKMEERVWTE